jgi:Flp pilus assembly protein TadG
MATARSNLSGGRFSAATKAGPGSCPAPAKCERPVPSLGGFLSCEAGAVTTEFTVLVPFFLMLLIFFADGSTVYLTHSEMYTAARDTARRMSTEEITTIQEAQQYAAGRLLLSGRSYTVTPSFGGDMTVTISLSIQDAAIFGYFLQPILGRQLSASSTMRREPLA